MLFAVGYLSSTFSTLALQKGRGCGIIKSRYCWLLDGLLFWFHFYGVQILCWQTVIVILFYTDWYIF
jgi:hypothetical protein